MTIILSLIVCVLTVARSDHEIPRQAAYVLHNAKIIKPRAGGVKAYAICLAKNKSAALMPRTEQSGFKICSPAVEMAP